MNNILEQLNKKLEDNQYRIDNFEYLKQNYLILDKVTICLLENNGKKAARELKKISREELIRTFVICSRFFDTKEEHENEIETFDFLMYDGKNLRTKINKLSLVSDLCIVLYQKKHEVISDEIYEEILKEEEVFKKIYGEDYFDIWDKLSEDQEMLLYYDVAYGYYDILNHDFTDELIVVEADKTRKNITTLADLVRSVKEKPEKDYSIDKYSSSEKKELEKKLTYYFIVNLDAAVEYIFDKIELYEKTVKKLRKENGKLLQKIERIKELYSRKENEMISTVELRNLLDDSEDSLSLLSSVAKSNIDLVSKIEETFAEKEKIIYLLYNYHYNYDELNLDDISSINIDILKQNLDNLDIANIVLYNNNLEYIIKSNKLVNTIRLKSLLSKNYITNTVINKNIDILFDDSIFDNYNSNVKLFEKYSINVVDIVNSYYEMLFINNSYLERIFNLYSLYNIKLDSNNIIRLIDTTNFDYIDLYIEEGYYDFIINNIDLLEQRDVIPKRLYINNLVNSDISIYNFIDCNLLNEGSFFVKNEYLDSACASKVYVFENKEIKKKLDEASRLDISEETLNSDIVIKLDGEYREDDIYNFDGVIISRNKVLRNLEVIKDMLYSEYDKVLNSVIYNSILGVDDVNTISSELKILFDTPITLK